MTKSWKWADRTLARSTVGRKALVNLLDVFEYNKGVTKTKRWEKIRLLHRPNSSNIKIGIIKTNAIRKTYLQESL
jgi:hypothetical protein